MTERREKGFVKWFTSRKRLGVIRNSNGLDLIVEGSAIQPGLPTLKPGANVRFEMHIGPQGLKATNVELMDELKTEGA